MEAISSKKRMALGHVVLEKNKCFSYDKRIYMMTDVIRDKHDLNTCVCIDLENGLSKVLNLSIRVTHLPNAKIIID